MFTRKLVEKIITTALSGDDVFVSPAVYSPWPLLSAALQCSFVYGSGGISIDAYVQTSIDGGNAWIDVAQFHFLTTTELGKRSMMLRGVRSGRMPKLENVIVWVRTVS
jgi:hypothetical protein